MKVRRNHYKQTKTKSTNCQANSTKETSTRFTSGWRKMVRDIKRNGVRVAHCVNLNCLYRITILIIASKLWVKKELKYWITKAYKLGGMVIGIYVNTKGIVKMVFDFKL